MCSVDCLHSIEYRYMTSPQADLNACGGRSAGDRRRRARTPSSTEHDEAEAANESEPCFTTQCVSMAAEKGGANIASTCLEREVRDT